MKITSRIFRIVYTLYCVAPFALSFLIVIPLYFLIFNFVAAEKSPHIAHRVSRYWAKFLFTFFFIRFRCRNREAVDPSGTYVFIANHRSFLDIPAYALACTNTFRFLSKEELARIPLLGYVIKNLYITVKRGDKNDRHRSMDKMLTSLRNGISVFIAPEGTRNLTEKPLLDFKDGAFRLAIASKLPLAILVLHNSGKLLSPKRPLEMSPGIIYGEWLDPIPTADLTEKDLVRLKERVRLAMEEVITKRP